MLREKDPVGAELERGPHRYSLAMAAAGLAAAVLLYLLSRAHYPLFHSIVDGVTIFIAGSVFLVVWTGRRRLDNDYYLFVAIAFLAFALLDFMHLVGNQGMGVFPQYGNLGPTFYIASRYVLGLSFLLAPLFIKRKVGIVPVFSAFLLVVVLVLLSVLYWRNFPATYIEGTGLTAFKVTSDYAVCVMLLGGLGLLLLNRRAFDARVLKIIALSLVFSIATGLAFTLYADPFGITNAVGHFFQIASFYLVYLGFVETALTKPQNILYHNLKQGNDSILKLNSELEQVNLSLSNDIAARKRAEDELRASEQRLVGVLESMPDAFVSFDRDMRYTYVNANAERMQAARREDLLGKDVREIYPDAESRKTISEYERVIREQEPLTSTSYHAGFGRWVEVRAFPTPEGVSVFYKDVSAQFQVEQALRESEERLRLFIEHAPASLAMFDRQMRYLSVSRRWLSDYGLEGREIMGQSHYSLFPDIPDLRREFHRRGLNGEVVRMEEDPFQRADGSLQWLRWEIRPWRDAGGGVAGIVIFTEDITERKRTEEALRLLNAELEHRVEERTVDLAQTVNALQEEVASRQLAEKALHQRSEQLRALASELTLAEQRERRRLAEVLHDDLQQILVGAKFRLGPLQQSSDTRVREAVMEVGDLLQQSIECSRKLTGELSPPILQYGGFVPALEWLAVWMRQKHGQVVEVAADDSAIPETEDMKILLFQSVRELLFNSVKHSKAKKAQVEARRVNDCICVTVADKGAGFDPSKLRLQGGSSGGFGLFSIRERLDLLGGRMEIDSAPGQGSRFTLWAPLRNKAAMDSAAAPAQVTTVPVRDESQTALSGTEKRKIRILLVDDHIVMRQGVAQLLKAQPDMEVVGEASDGLAAVDSVRQLRPDVVLMDIGMPRMNGIEATKLIHAEHPEVRIIGLSMFEEKERAEAMRNAGAVNYVAKSGPADELTASIRECVNREP